MNNKNGFPKNFVLIVYIFILGIIGSIPANQKLVTISDFGGAKTNGAAWNSPGAVIIGTGGLKIVNEQPLCRKKSFEISTDNDDKYEVSFYNHEKVLWKKLLGGNILSGGGLYVHKLNIPEKAAKTCITHIVVIPSGGDGYYSVGHISFYEKKWEKETPTFDDFNFEEAAKNIPKPKEMWHELKKEIVPLDITIDADTITVCDYTPSMKIRKIHGRFFSQNIDGVQWMHRFTLLLPAKNSINQKKPRKGKVVIIGAPVWDGFFPIHEMKYAEPIVAYTQYPVMVVANPGYDSQGKQIEVGLQHRLGKLAQRTGKIHYNAIAQCAVVYIRAMDACEQILKVKKVSAVIGGHSKRGGAAPFAAAIDSRVAGVISIGFELVHPTDRVGGDLPYYYTFYQDQVSVPVFYIGGTNETAYEMFTISEMQKMLKKDMVVEMIPNYSHTNFSEIQYMDFLLWTSHVFDNRPIPRISDISYRHVKKEPGTLFSARIQTKSTIQLVRLWYAYTDNAAWKDVMWFHRVMEPNAEGLYEEWLPGIVPDAYYIEVGDIAHGIEGYISSTPTPVTDKKIEPRISRGDFPRFWKRRVE